MSSVVEKVLVAGLFGNAMDSNEKLNQLNEKLDKDKRAREFNEREEKQRAKEEEWRQADIEAQARHDRQEARERERTESNARYCEAQQLEGKLDEVYKLIHWFVSSITPQLDSIKAEISSMHEELSSANDELNSMKEDIQQDAEDKHAALLETINNITSLLKKDMPKLMVEHYAVLLAIAKKMGLFIQDASQLAIENIDDAEHKELARQELESEKKFLAMKAIVEQAEKTRQEGVPSHCRKTTKKHDKTTYSYK